MTTGQLPTSEVTPPIGNQSATPIPAATPQKEDPATEAARLRQEKIDLEKRLAEKDAHITELSTDKATLEQRLSGFTPANPATPAAPASGTPASEYVRPEEVNEIVERNTFVNKMKDENKDMMEFGLEPIITIRANELMQKGKGFKEAVSTAVSEQREKFNKLKAPTPTDQTPPPAGAQGEGGASVPAIPKEPVPDVLGDEGEERKRQRIKKGL